MAQQAAQECILVVDDDMAACMVLKRMVERLGLSCDIARDGVEAIAASRIKCYHVVFMDVFLPVKNGLDAAVEIGKSCCEIKRPKIIGMLSIDDMDTRRQCRDSGMTDVLCKPISRAVLQQSIARKEILADCISSEIQSPDQRCTHCTVHSEIRDVPSSISLKASSKITNSMPSSRRHRLLLQVLQARRAAMSAARDVDCRRGHQSPPEMRSDAL